MALTPSQLTALRTMIRDNFKELSFIENVDQNRTPVVKLFLDSEPPPVIDQSANQTLNWMFQPRDFPGGLVTEQMYQRIPGARHTGMTQARAHTARSVVKWTYDLEETILKGKANKDRLVDVLEYDRLQVSQKITDQWDEQFTMGYASAADAASDARKFDGIGTMIAPSCVQDGGSAGQYLANPDGGWNGGVIRYRNGEVSTTRYGYNPNDPNIKYGKNYTITDNERGINRNVIRKLSKMARALDFRSAPMKVNASGAKFGPIRDGSKGAMETKQTYNHVLLLDDERFDAYEDFLSYGRQNLGDDAIINMEKTTIARMKYFRVPRLKDLPGFPVYAINMEHFGLYKFPEFWGLKFTTQDPEAPTADLHSEHFIGQLLLVQPRKVGVFHGAF